jgi:hypothetical protein
LVDRRLTVVDSPGKMPGGGSAEGLL